MSFFLPPLPPTWQAALRDVNAQSVSARVAAATRLARPEPGDERDALHGLLALARDPDPRVRIAAVEALSELRDPQALELLADRTADPDPTVRELAVIAIAQLPDAVGGELLLSATESAYPELRFQAVVSVAELCPERAEPSIRCLLDDEDERVRASALRAAGLLPEPFRTPELRRRLVDSLRDGHALVRGEAAVLLARLGEARAAAALREALDDAELVWQALDAAPRLRDAELLERIAQLAESFLKPRILKAAAARALLRMSDARGIPALREVLFAFRGDGRGYAVEVIGELELTELAPDLARLARRPRGVEPGLLARTLATLAPKSPIAREALERLARKP